MPYLKVKHLPRVHQGNIEITRVQSDQCVNSDDALFQRREDTYFLLCTNLPYYLVGIVLKYLAKKNLFTV